MSALRGLIDDALAGRAIPTFPWAIEFAPDGPEAAVRRAWEADGYGQDAARAAYMTGQREPFYLFLEAGITSVLSACGPANAERKEAARLLRDGRRAWEGGLTVDTRGTYAPDIFDDLFVARMSGHLYSAAENYALAAFYGYHDLKCSVELLVNAIGFLSDAVGFASEGQRAHHRWQVHNLQSALRAPTLSEWQKVEMR